MKFFEQCKRIFQSYDFRFNKIYNVKTPNLTDESHGEEVSNKNYVDGRTVFQSSRNPNFNEQQYGSEPQTINEVLDYVLHEKLSDANTFVKPQLTDVNIFVEQADRINNRFTVFKSRNYRMHINVSVSDNDFIGENDNNVIRVTYGGETSPRMVANGSNLFSIDLYNFDRNRGDDVVFTRTYNNSVAKTHNGQLTKYQPLPYLFREQLTKVVYDNVDIIDDIHIRIIDESIVQGDLNSLALSMESSDYRKYDNLNFNGGKIAFVSDKYRMMDIAIPETLYSKYDLGWSVHSNASTYQTISGKINLTSCLHAFPNSEVFIEGVLHKVFRWNFGITNEQTYILLNPTKKFNPLQ